MDDKKQICIEKFQNGSVCSQAILSVYGPLVGLNENFGHKLGTGLGAGFGRKQYACGAVSAGVLLLSLKYGNEHPGDFEKKNHTYDVVFNFIERIEKKLGCIDCRGLLGVSIKTDPELEEAVERGVFRERCVGVIGAVIAEMNALLSKTSIL